MVELIFHWEPAISTRTPHFSKREAGLCERLVLQRSIGSMPHWFRFDNPADYKFGVSRNNTLQHESRTAEHEQFLVSE